MARNRKSWLAGATLALLTVVALVHLGTGRRRSPADRAEAAEAIDERAPSVAPPAPVAPARSQRGDVAGAIHVRQARLIESIDVVPASPCRDQEVLVTVRLLPDARASKVFVAGQQGSPMVLRFSRSGRQPVPVVARDWTDRIEHQDVSISVGDCSDDSGLTLEVRRFGGGRILARASGPAASSAGGVDFEWDFGDGAHALTHEPAAEHDYALRDQSAPTSTFLIAVRAQPSDGRPATARASVVFVNADYIAALSGTPTLPVRYDRFARKQDGAAVTEIELRNVLPADVRWDSVETKAFSCDGTGEPLRRSGEAGLALSSGAIAVGGVEKVRLSIPADWLGPDACRAQVWLRGRAGQAEVRVPLALELGVPADRMPVTDPERLALLARAARVLGGTRFTEQDLAHVQAMAGP